MSTPSIDSVLVVTYADIVDSLSMASTALLGRRIAGEDTAELWDSIDELLLVHSQLVTLRARHGVTSAHPAAA